MKKPNDTERLDWLEDKSFEVYGEGTPDGDFTVLRLDTGSERGPQAIGKTLRDAIDALMKDMM